MGTSSVYNGPVTSKKPKIVVQTAGLQGGMSFGSSEIVNWSGAKRTLTTALKKGEPYFIPILKSLLAKSGAIDALLISMNPGLALIVDIGCALYGIETSSNKTLIKVVKTIDTTISFNEGLNRIKNLTCPEASKKDSAALADSITMFMARFASNVHNDIKYTKYLDQKTKDDQIKYFLAIYLEKQIMVYLASKLEESEISVEAQKELQKDNHITLLSIINQYDMHINQYDMQFDTKNTLSTTLKDILQKMVNGDYDDY